MVLETFIAINSAVLATKMINTKIEEKMNEKIINEGLYHVTTDENADLILESGYIKPSNAFISLGSKKCYFFAGAPTYNDLCKNVASSSNKYEFCAIKIDLKKDAQGSEIPNEKARDILLKFKQRSFNDDSITYKGKCDIKDKCATKVQMVLDIDKKGNIYSREKTAEEIQKGAYNPPQELIDKININSSITTNLLKSYPKEITSTYSKLFNKIKSFITKRKTNTKMLNEKPNIDENSSPKNDMMTNLKDLVNNDIDINENLNDESNTKNKQKENSEIEII